MLRAITFDLWKTLLSEKSYTTARLEILFNALKTEGQIIREEDLAHSYAEAQRRHNELWEKDNCHYPLMDRLDYIISGGVGATLSSSGKKIAIKRFEELIKKDPPEMTPGAEEAITILSRHFKLGIISDTGIISGTEIRKLFKRFRLLRSFSATIFSDETGICKPKGEVFALALRHLGVRAGEALHVGDLLRTDVAGAKTAGMKTAWLKVREPDAENVSPDYTIASIGELLTVPEIRKML